MVVRRLFAYLKPHRRALLLAFAMLLVATTAEVMGPILIKIFIDDYLAPGIIDWSAFIFLGGAYLALIFVGAGLQYLQLVSFNKIALRVIQQLRIDVFGKVQHLGLAVFDKTPTGALVSRITNDTEAIKELYLSVLSTFVQNIVYLTGVFIAMFFLDVRLAAFCLILLPIIAALMHIYRVYSSRTYRVIRKKLAQLNAKLNESIQGMNIIQAMRQEKRLRAEFEQINQEYYQASLLNVKLESLLVRPAVSLVYTFALVLVLAYFGYESLNGTIQVGVLYAFVNYLQRFFEPINMMMQRLSQLQQALVSAERVFEIMDNPDVAPGQAEPSDRAPEIDSGQIEFRNVSFSYDGTTDVLKDISFTVYPGQTVALVGHTGSGKSTIANLLLNFYKVKSGEILIDGWRLADFSNDELRAKIGLVLQDPFLFVGDINKNIGMERANLTQEDIVEAAEMVQADSFIRRLPQGYGANLGERGATLSSGQRQLLCFARTIAGKPKILVLDEATASVDTETEEAIQAALHTMRQGRSTIAIAHRLSTIQDADLILVLHRGRIVEQGTHQELLAREGLYNKMYRLQQGLS